MTTPEPDRTEPARVTSTLGTLRGFYGPVCSAECFETLGVRVLTWRETLGLTPEDLAAVCRVLFRPSVAQGIRYPSDLLAAFAEAVADQVRRRQAQDNWTARRVKFDPAAREQVRALAEGIGTDVGGNRSE